MRPAPDIPDHVPPGLVHRFDFRNDPQLRADPWGTLAGLQQAGDIFFSPDLGGYWVVTRAALIEEVFADHERFTATSVAIPKIENPVPLIPNNYDPPAHTAYRKMMAGRMFSPRALATMPEDTRRLARELRAGFEPGRCEFVEDFAYRLPIDVFLDLMGADPEHREECLAFVKLVFRGTNLEETGAGFAAADAFITGWLDEQLAAPDRNEGPMFRAMVTAEVEGRPLTREEMYLITMMLFMGGLDTVTSQLTHIMRFLAESEAHRQRLVDEPSVIPAALEEMLRRFGIAFIGRAAAKDMTFHGVEMRKGDPVCAAAPLAGLDAAQFPDPLRVDFDRAGKGRKVRHLGFGAGPHLCIGAYLARTQIAITLEELLPTMPGLRLAEGADIENRPGATMMLASLPLAWDA